MYTNDCQELRECPFCGAKAEIVVYDPEESWDYRMEIEHDESCWLASSRPSTRNYYTKAEAIDAWNTRAERTCKPLGTIRYDYEGGYAGFEYETELSCGHKWHDTYGDYPDFCPWCGAKVIEE